MPDNCIDTNLHHNSGTSQAQRALPGLSVDYAKVDERSTSDLLLFAKKYGAYLNYYNEKNELTGNWSAFMAKDISVIIAHVQNWQRQGRDYSSYINDLYDKIKSDVPADAMTHFKYIFDLAFSFTYTFNNVLRQLPDDSDYSVFLKTVIASKLAIPVNQLAAYYASFLTSVLLGVSNLKIDPLAPFDDMILISPDPTLFQAMFNFINDEPWKLPAGVIIPPATIFTGDTIVDIITNNFFTGAVTSFFNGAINIVNQTASFIEKTLLNYPDHEPAYALYLSFLRLFRFAQNHLNEYTKRHLKFYYKKVLRLENSPGLSDTVHLVFSSQKSIDQHLLARGTQFKAGKDASNHEIFYALTDDLVVNQATVQALKSLYVVKNYKTGSGNVPQKLFASSVANSSDGQGGKLTSADKSWFPFGDLGNNDFIARSTAQAGFAIASNILYLREGIRTITLTFNCDPSSHSILAGLGSYPSSAAISAWFTGNKKWFDASEYFQTGIVLQTDTTQNQFKISIGISGDAPPIVPYTQKLHGGNFTQPLPMIKIMIADYTHYLELKSLKIASIGIDVSVDAVKNLSLQNDAGKLDSSKPFKPFGDFPDDYAAFIIGSKEIFQKKLSALSINFAWQDSPVSPTMIEGVALVAGKWATVPFCSVDIGSNLLTLTSTEQIPQSIPDFTENENYSNTSVNGFIRLQLVSPSHYYSLATYLASISSATTKVVTQTQPTGEVDYTVTPPSPPPAQRLIIAQLMTVTYSAYEEIMFTESTLEDFGKRGSFFYHIEPFGFREMHPFLFTLPVETNPSLGDNILHLFPVFNMDNEAADSSDVGNVSGHNNEGELWIGLNNTKPGEAHSILFQVSQGSSNPLKKVTTINWFYLSSNNWILLDPTTQINDQTNNLSESGLVIFNLPGDETTNNTRAENKLVWIKGLIRNDTDSICKLIAIQTNASKAKFVINPNEKIFFTANVAAGTISKPVIADASLKQTSQPYPSFGGMTVESDVQFNRRVSERLRHKHRAVSAWDYERLILQNFPEIHKVKCLNHTSLKSKTQDYNEMKPGDVMIVTVPELGLLTGANPLLPFTNVGLLEEIKKFIKPLCSPFVHVHVCNPQFEAVQFDFNVYFANNNSNSSYYAQQLNTDIQKFLMPWAFGSSNADIEFGGMIEKSVVLNFVQTRPYVDFVTCFKMLKYTYQEDGTFSSPTADADEAIASTARSILVPYTNHTISPTANCDCNG